MTPEWPWDDSLDALVAAPAGTTPPTAIWGAALPPHTLENVGETLIHIISTELKSAAHRQGAPPTR